MTQGTSQEKRAEILENSADRLHIGNTNLDTLQIRGIDYLR